jgi:hypothetical protein
MTLHSQVQLSFLRLLLMLLERMPRQAQGKE